MVKSVLGVSHQGLRDWAIQRVTAILIAIYSIGLLAYFLLHPELVYSEWRQLFSHVSMKVATLIFVLSMLFHAWVGIWTVVTDYVKCYVARASIHTLVLLLLMACFFWALFILWSV